MKLVPKLTIVTTAIAVLTATGISSATAANFNLFGTLEDGSFSGTFSIPEDASFPPGLPGSSGPIEVFPSAWDINITREGNLFTNISGSQPSSNTRIDIGILGEEIFIFTNSENINPLLYLVFVNDVGNRPIPQNPPPGAFGGGSLYFNGFGSDSVQVTSATITLSSTTQSVPEASNVSAILLTLGLGWFVKKRGRF
jgi:hypothetical protein